MGFIRRGGNICIRAAKESKKHSAPSHEPRAHEPNTAISRKQLTVVAWHAAIMLCYYNVGSSQAKESWFLSDNHVIIQIS